jgi:hypothetical protein
MTEPSIMELRRAAEQARVFAMTLTEPRFKQGFSDLADKWDAQATALELKNGSIPFHGLGAGV